MVLMNGLPANADDSVKNVITLTENMIQSTKLSADAEVTDISRSNAKVDVFTDSNGFNNSVNTGSTTCDYDSTNERYTANATTGSSENAPSISGDDGTTQSLTTNLTIINVGYISQVRLRISESGGSGGNIIVNIKDDDGTTVASKTYPIVPGVGTVTFTETNYSKFLKIGSGQIVVTCTNHKRVDIKNNQSHSGTNFSYSSTYVPGDSSTWFTYQPKSYADAVLITSSENFDFNLASCLVNAEADTPTNTSITVDVSTDGGSVYDVTGQALKDILVLDNDDADLVLKFNFSTTDTAVTPSMSGYAAQLFEY